jgi:hypothetical protein
MILTNANNKETTIFMKPQDCIIFVGGNVNDYIKKEKKFFVDTITTVNLIQI